MAAEPALIMLINRLQNPIPQYVLGSLPIITIIGTTPRESLLWKLLWFMRCLGCPFTGMLYFCNIEKKKVEMCVYWLESVHFIKVDKKKENGDDDCKIEISKGNKENDNKIEIGISEENKENDNEIGISEENKENDNENGNDKNLSVRPVGHYAMKIDPYDSQRKVIEDWVAEASLLDRLSSLVSAYYISVGIFVGIFRATRPCIEDKSLQDWPYIPLLFIWTLPVIYIRLKNGRVVDKVLPERLEELEKKNTSDVL
ncbi:5364_t:CDS:1 [Cetraspora pellucida]|uniref:5364_t:CDS:1 n=1 Tax=Cetraspora pellucida TaxID=1433469 RepID=A0ACA9MGI7_9GLOM|nr:5364_t:CDS:1 [Cetraspora pellucida]